MFSVYYLAGYQVYGKIIDRKSGGRISGQISIWYNPSCCCLPPEERLKEFAHCLLSLLMHTLDHHYHRLEEH